MAGDKFIHVLLAEASFNEADRMVSALKDAAPSLFNKNT